MEYTQVDVGDVEHLEKGLLLSDRSNNTDNDNEPILYSASFLEAEDNFIKLKTTQWILYSLVLLLAWGFGLVMFLYIPIRRYVVHRMIRSRILYLTPNAIVYEGLEEREACVSLASVADVVIEQGYLQSHYVIYSIRIENVGVRRPPSDDVLIEGIVNPQAFRKVHDVDSSEYFQSYAAPLLMSPSKSLTHDTLSHVDEFAILQKLEEVGNSLMRVETLIEE